jgi:hypothetical protein
LPIFAYFAPIFTKGHIFCSVWLKRKYQIYCGRRVSGMVENRRIEKSNNFKVVGSNKIKRPKQDSKNWLRS